MFNWIRRKLGIDVLESRVLHLEQLLKRSPVRASEAALIAEWVREMSEQPVGSPKYIAFKNRLESLGYRHGE